MGPRTYTFGSGGALAVAEANGKSGAPRRCNACKQMGTHEALRTRSFVGSCRRSRLGRSYRGPNALQQREDTSGRPGLLIWRAGSFPPRVDAHAARTFRSHTSGLVLGSGTVLPPCTDGSCTLPRNGGRQKEQYRNIYRLSREKSMRWRSFALLALAGRGADRVAGTSPGQDGVAMAARRSPASTGQISGNYRWCAGVEPGASNSCPISGGERKHG